MLKISFIYFFPSKVEKGTKHCGCPPAITSLVSKWSDISTIGLSFQRASTIAIQLCVLGKYKCNLMSPWYSGKIAHLALNNNNHSLRLFANIFCFELSPLCWSIFNRWGISICVISSVFFIPTCTLEEDLVSLKTKLTVQNIRCKITTFYTII
jgi:hypothetical protein